MQRRAGRPRGDVRRLRIGTLFLLPNEYDALIASSLPTERPITTAARLLGSLLAPAQTEGRDLQHRGDRE